jgi:hypothetical protein
LICFPQFSPGLFLNLASAETCEWIHTKRQQKQVPGHQIQVDVKFLKFIDKSRRAVKRYQSTAIDDATRARGLKIYARHNRKNACDFIDYVIEKFLFRIREIRTDRENKYRSRPPGHWKHDVYGLRKDVFHGPIIVHGIDQYFQHILI